MTSSVLLDFQIKGEVEAGNIIISEFNPSQLNTCSYNVRLGSNYFLQCRADEIINPLDGKSVRSIWKKGEVKDGMVIIPARSKVLCHTEEFIGSKRGSVTMLKSRSSIMRAGLDVGGGAGWGDIGFFNRWVFTITNTGFNTFNIPVGSQVAQIVFLSTGQTINSYQGQYQSTDDIKDMIKNWSPDDMLPKAK